MVVCSAGEAVPGHSGSYCSLKLDALTSLYGFHHLDASHRQGDEHVAEYCNMLSRFRASAYLQGTQMDDDSKAALSGAIKMLASHTNVHWLPKYGCALLQLTSQTGISLQSDTACLHLICLDDWNHYLHSTLIGIQHTANCKDSKVMYIGELHESRLDLFLDSTTLLMQKAIEEKVKKGEKGHQRTPAFVLEVMKRVLKEVDSLEEAEDILNVDVPHAKGGFTDVGQHTGSEPRDTAWPLVQQVLKVVLELVHNDSPAVSSSSRNPHIFDQAMMHLDLWILGLQSQLLTKSSVTPDLVSANMQILRSAATKVAALADDGFDVTTTEEVIADARKHIDAIVGEYATDTAGKYTFPDVEGCWPAYQLPKGVIPSVMKSEMGKDGLAEAYYRAQNNLGSLPVLPEDTSWAKLLEILTLPSLAHGKAAKIHRQGLVLQHRLRMVEAVLFKKVLSEDTIEYSMMEAEALEAIVDKYLIDVNGLLSLPASATFMRVELHSRAVLVGWCAYCLLHNQAFHKHPLLQQYGVALNHNNMAHLVLSDKHAEDAAIAVASYLNKHTKSNRAVFSLSPAEQSNATLEIALLFAEQSDVLKKLWSNESDAASIRREARWQKVKQKKAEVINLQEEIRKAKSEHAELKSTLQALQYSYYCDEERCTKLQYETNNKNRQIASLESQLDNTRKAPSPVVQPLPAAQSKALQWLFFLHMGTAAPLLRILARSAFLCQQLLVLPLEPDMKEKLKVAPYPTSIVGHYNNKQSTEWYRPGRVNVGSDGDVKLKCRGAVPDTIGSTTVDHMNSADDGVWHPDSWNPELAWEGIAQKQAGGSVPKGASEDYLKHLGTNFPKPFNPFAADASYHNALILAYTEKLPVEQEKKLQKKEEEKQKEGEHKYTPLQQFMDCRDSKLVHPARSNLGIAQQAVRPHWLSQPGFLDFASLRAYPDTQLVIFCTALNNRHLPLEQPVVQTLIRQAFYHLGSLEMSESSRLIERCWRQTFDTCELPALIHEFDKLANELQAPRGQPAVALLGELAAYLSGIKPDTCFRDIARRFADMTANVADSLNKDIQRWEKQASESQGSKEEVSRLHNIAQQKAKQIVWRSMALRCHFMGTLSQNDAAQMLKLMVLLNHGHVFLDVGHDTQLSSQVSHALLTAHRVMAARHLEVIEAASKHGSLLTQAVACVLGQDDELVGLDWKPVLRDSNNAEGATASFQAEHGGHLYSINILDGTVLKDGYPPSRLPIEITSHPLFLRTFGAVNFEVFKTSDGVLQTSQPISSKVGSGSRRYKFSLCGDGNKMLIVTEVDKHHRVELELLDAGPNSECTGWGSSLPIRLRAMHSHWICRAQNTILLRPRDFQDRSVQFVLRYGAPHELAVPADNDGNVEQQYDCRRVPLYLQPSHWMQLLQEKQIPDRLVLPTETTSTRTVHSILAKFEPVMFIHVHEPAEHNDNSTCVEKLRYELPRYGLEFELDKGTGDLHCLQYTGYRLGVQQQLVRQLKDQIVYTLPNFTRYLVLERLYGVQEPVVFQRAETLVLIPRGEVMRLSTGMVDVCVASDCDATLKCHCCEVHGRFNYLTAKTILARLQLAALYAASSTLLPEPGSCITSAQLAIQLVGQIEELCSR